MGNFGKHLGYFLFQHLVTLVVGLPKNCTISQQSKKNYSSSGCGSVPVVHKEHDAADDGVQLRVGLAIAQDVVLQSSV